MRKHFLILMLLALLPLAGWAQTVYDLSEAGWVIKLYPNGGGVEGISAVYQTAGTDNAPTVKLYNADYQEHGPVELTSDKFTATWNPSPVKNVRSEGYVVTVTSDMTSTVGSLTNATKKFYITKATSVAANADDHLLQNGWTFNQYPTGRPALTTDVTVNFGTVEYSIDYEEKGEQATWSTTIPTIDNVGTFTVYYRVQDDLNGNYNGIAPTKLVGNSTDVTATTIVVTGTPLVEITDYTAPVGVADLAVTWDNSKNTYASKALISAGTWADGTKGKFMYSSKLHSATTWSDWSEDVPEASEAGDYDVKWKIEPNKGYYKVDETAIVGGSVTIARMAAADFTVSNATGLTNLAYNKNDANPYQSLLSAAGSATKGASVLYKVSYRATSADAWTPDGSQQEVANFANVKGSNAGQYQITTYVADAGNHNYKEAADPIVVTIAKAQALTAAPTAIANLKWTNAAQQLIAAGTGTVTGKVQYIVKDAATPVPLAADVDWTTDINDASLKRGDAGTYYAWYQVTDPNYVAVEPTAIGTAAAPVKIAPATVSIIVNNRSKNYDGTGAINALDAVAAKFTVTNAVATADVNVAGLKYTNEDAGLGDDYKNANTYVGALTTTAAAVATLNGTWGTNYEYTIVPGNLTINPRPIYVEANAGLSATFGEDFDISKGYTIKGGEAGDVDASAATAEEIANFFTTAPVLTAPLATGTPVPVAVYDLAFTAGTTAANYTMNLEKGENLDGYFINGKKFEVVNDPTHKLVITVKPHKKTYDGVAESWADVNEGVDYVVSGLITGDEITKKPTFSRSDNTNYNVGTYVLSADLAEVSNYAAHYPGGIVYNNSTFDIEAKELVADVAQQTIYKTAGVTAGDIAIANAALDQTAWTVDGLENNETLADLGATLAVDNVGTTAGKTNISAPDFYDNGILLTITNTNYTLKAGTEYATLRVIAAETVELDPTNTKLAELIEAKKYVAATDNKYDVTFAHKTLKADRWYTMVLPFDVKTTELVNQLKDENGDEVYAIVNRLSESSTADHLKYTLEMKEIPANEPFLIKAASDVDLQDVTFATKKIIYTATPSVGGDDFAGNQFVGVYTATSIKNGTPANTVYGFLGDPDKATGMKNEWYQPKNNAWTVNPMEAYLIYSPNKTVSAPLITVEDFGGQTTAISTVNSDIKVISTDGWYTINGVKLQGAPTEKGIYINNGKKIVVK